MQAMEERGESGEESRGEVSSRNNWRAVGGEGGSG